MYFLVSNWQVCSKFITDYYSKLPRNVVLMYNSSTIINMVYTYCYSVLTYPVFNTKLDHWLEWLFGVQKVGMV